jgi:hypothetical protein
MRSRRLHESHRISASVTMLAATSGRGAGLDPLAQQAEALPELGPELALEAGPPGLQRFWILPQL